MRRLPLLTEVAVRESEARRLQKSAEFEQDLRLKAAPSDKHISCQKGCHHCCYYPVSVSPLEGITLYRWLAENGFWRRSFKAKLEEAHARVWGLSPSVWLLGMIPCPLLTEKGTCSAYEARPFACRTTLSFQSPEFCHPHRFGEASGIAPRRDIAEEMDVIENQLLKTANIPTLRLPLATAVLLAEKICNEELAAEDVLRQLLKLKT